MQIKIEDESQGNQEEEYSSEDDNNPEKNFPEYGNEINKEINSNIN